MPDVGEDGGRLRRCVGDAACEVRRTVQSLRCCETPAWALMGFDEYRKSCGPGRNIGAPTLGCPAGGLGSVYVGRT